MRFLLLCYFTGFIYCKTFPEIESVSDVNEIENKLDIGQEVNIDDLDNQSKSVEMNKTGSECYNEKCNSQKFNSLVNRIMSIHADNGRYLKTFPHLVFCDRIFIIFLQ